MPGELGFDTGPYVTVAAFCDRAITENDGVISLIRVIDVVNLQVQGPVAPDELPPGGILNTTFVLMIKAGRALGRQVVQINMEHPDTTVHPGPEQAVNLSGGQGGGANLIMQMQIQLSDTGLYWANVLINSRMMSRTPLQVNYAFTRGPNMGPVR